LTKDEIDILNRLVVIFLETAELRIKERISITMKFWTENVDKLLEFNNKPILTTKGSVSSKEMEEKVSDMYQSFDQRRKEFEALEADELDIKELKEFENRIKKREQ
jgi:hypothetical protein